MLFKGVVTFGENFSTNKACRRLPVADEGVHPSVINAAKPRKPHLSTPTEMATEIETVPTVLAVRVQVRACV